MKQQYITPDVRIQEIDTEALLAGSIETLNGSAQSAALGKENEMDWEDEE